MVDINTKPASELTKEETAARAGVDVSRVQGELGSYVIGPEATSTPQNFQVNDQTYTQPAIPNDDIVSDASGPRSDIESLGNDINKGLAEFGITPPDDGSDGIVDKMLSDFKIRESELAKREAEDKAAIEKGFAGSKEELQISQEEELAKAEGRTRIGGFLTRMEVEDIQKMQRLHRLELSAFEGQKQQALQTAQRAYSDQNYQLAKDQLNLVKSIEEQTYARKQDYFNNVLKFKQMSTPIMEAEQAVQDYALKALMTYRSGFTDLKTEDIPRLTLAEIQRRILSSKEYQAELAQPSTDGPAIQQEYEYAKSQGYKGTFIQYQALKASQFGTEKGDTPVSALTTAQRTALKGAGLNDELINDITDSILGGVELETIRQALKTMGLDPQILDTYDKVVSIANLLDPRRTQFKITGSTDGDNPFQ